MDKLFVRWDKAHGKWDNPPHGGMKEIRALQHGIELGMNLVDTAEMYDNEELVGEASPRL